MPSTARDIMTSGAECASVNDTVTDAAKKMRDLGVGALPICGDDNRLAGMITDRDIVIKCVAEGHDTTSMKVSEYAANYSDPSNLMQPRNEARHLTPALQTRGKEIPGSKFEALLITSKHWTHPH